MYVIIIFGGLFSRHLNRQSYVLSPFIRNRSQLNSQFHTFGLQSIFPNKKNSLNGTDFTKSMNIVPNNFWSLNTVRSKGHAHVFPKPREVKRVTKFGWFARMKTPGGRAILMRRILKGRHVLSH